MIIGINNFSAPTSLTFGSITGPALYFIASPTLNPITSPTLGSIAGLFLDSVINPAPGIDIGRVFLIVIDLINGNYFYGKQVIVEDLTNFKLYMKETI